METPRSPLNKMRLTGSQKWKLPSECMKWAGTSHNSLWLSGNTPPVSARRHRVTRPLAAVRAGQPHHFARLGTLCAGFHESRQDSWAFCRKSLLPCASTPGSCAAHHCCALRFAPAALHPAPPTAATAPSGSGHRGEVTDSGPLFRSRFKGAVAKCRNPLRLCFPTALATLPQHFQLNENDMHQLSEPAVIDAASSAVRQGKRAGVPTQYVVATLRRRVNPQNEGTQQ